MAGCFIFGILLQYGSSLDKSVANIARSSNGRTAAFEAAHLGSNPSRASNVE